MKSKEFIQKELEKRRATLASVSEKVHYVNGLLKEHTVSSYLVRGDVVGAKQCTTSRMKLLKQKKLLLAEEEEANKSVIMAEERLSLYEKDNA